MSREPKRRFTSRGPWSKRHLIAASLEIYVPSDMQALAASALPVGPNWQYEPKWDGFRCLALRDHKRIDLLSKSGKALMYARNH
jgi:ATP-dependent DNA ligase